MRVMLLFQVSQKEWLKAVATKAVDLVKIVDILVNI